MATALNESLKLAPPESDRNDGLQVDGTRYAEMKKNPHFSTSVFPRVATIEGSACFQPQYCPFSDRF